MRIKARYIHPELNPGTTRLQRKFAWLPVLISGEWVWMQFYELLQVWKLDTDTAIIEEEEKQFFNGYWKNISVRLCA